MNTTVDHHPIKDLLLGKSLVDLIHPEERTLAKQDFNSFTHLTTLAGAVTRCRLRKLDCIARYNPTEQTTDLDWIVVDVIMYTAAENMLLTFFHCDQGYPVCPHVQCNQETEMNELPDLSFLFQRYSHVSPLQEQSIGTLRAFQLYNNVTQTVVTSWPHKEHLPFVYEDVVEAIQYDFQQALAHHRHPSFPPCTQHARSTSQLDFESHGTLRFEKILIHYGQLTFAVFKILPTHSPVSLQRPHYLSCQNTDLPLPQIQTPRKDQHYSAPFFKQRLSSSSTVSKSWRIKPSEKKRCESCQTSHSPEWRRGPSGHRTLCNACGLSYVQQQQQQQLPFSSFSDDLCTLSSSSTSSSSASSSSASSPSLPQYPQSHAKYPGQRRFFNLYP